MCAPKSATHFIDVVSYRVLNESQLAAPPAVAGTAVGAGAGDPGGTGAGDPEASANTSQTPCVVSHWQAVSPLQLVSSSSKLEQCAVGSRAHTPLESQMSAFAHSVLDAHWSPTTPPPPPPPVGSAHRLVVVSQMSGVAQSVLNAHWSPTTPAPPPAGLAHIPLTGSQMSGVAHSESDAHWSPTSPPPPPLLA